MSNERIQRRLVAILAADAVGYSRLMEWDETSTLTELKLCWSNVVQPLVTRHQGRVFKTIGDAILAEFGSAIGAVECAIEVQQVMAVANADAPAERRIVLRIGVHLGDVIVEGSDLYGDGVNVATRIEELADPGGVVISDGIHEHIRGRLGIDFVDGGNRGVKNIERALHIWTWSPQTATPADAAGGLQPPRGKPSIAVLPFDNMSGDPEQGYFADGITEDIITDLSKVSGLFVIARNSSFAYKGQAPDVRRVSRELGVRYVLEGSVRRAANRIRINAQMIDGTTGGHLWAERYDRGLEDIFAVQDEVTRTIVSALEVKLTAGEEARRRRMHGKVDPEVYDLIVRARQTALQFRPEASVAARKMLERALAIDPGLAPGYSGLAMVTFADYANQWNGATEDNLTKARELAHKAIETDDTEPQGYIALALCLSWMRRLDEAEHEAERAIALDPNSAQALSVLGSVRDFQGRHEDAVALFARGHRLDPQFDMSLHLMGRALLALGRFDEAEVAFKRRLALAPQTDMTRFYLACLYGLTGRHDEARRHWQETQQVNPNFSVERLGQLLPYRDPSQLGRLVDGLRNAGIAI
jgi:adenylate cyclase